MFALKFDLKRTFFIFWSQKKLFCWLCVEQPAMIPALKLPVLLVQWISTAGSVIKQEKLP